MTIAPVRCPWNLQDDLMIHYHDTEWGKPVRDSRALWEKLMLDGFQAGLSWRIVLKNVRHCVSRSASLSRKKSLNSPKMISKS